MNLRLALYLLLAGYTTICFAQSERKYTNYIPLSPNLASIRQHVDYPVSGATGLPATGFPLFSVDLDKYSLPVNISYHVSGWKTSLNLAAISDQWGNIVAARELIRRKAIGDAFAFTCLLIT